MARKKMTRKEMNAILDMTEEELDVRAEEYESDTWDASHLDKVVMGRPSIADEEAHPITVNFNQPPALVHQYLDRVYSRAASAYDFNAGLGSSS